MQILVVVLLPKEVEEEAKQISLKYQPQLYVGKELPPHLTLIPPATLIGRINDLEQTIDRVMNDNPNIEVKVQGIGYFSRRNNVVYLQVELSTELESLQRSLRKSISSLIQGNSSGSLRYRPHITLAKKLDRNRLFQILDELKIHDPTFTFPLQEVGLFVMDEQERFWRLRKIFH